MSIDDERVLRRRLDGALEAVTPSPAPVAATLRKGRTMRTRRRIGVAAGLAFAAGIALAAPSLVHQFARPAPVAPPARPVLAVYPPGPRSPRGQIAWGTIDGKRWQVAVTSPSGPHGQCLVINSQDPNRCDPPARASQNPSLPVDFRAFSENGVDYEYGVVQPDVTRVGVALADGTNVTLHPHPLYGQRWVAFAVPADMAITNATAYSKQAELARATPYGVAFVAWLRPGQPGLPRATYVIGSGVVNGGAWSDVVHVGPWGYCRSTIWPSSGQDVCTPVHSRTATGNSYSESLPITDSYSIIQGEASPTVAYVVGTLSDGSTVRARAVDTGGPRFWACAVPQDLRPRSVVFYSASGRQVAVADRPVR